MTHPLIVGSIILLSVTSLFAEYTAEDGSRMMGSPSPEQKKRIDAKRRSEKAEALSFEPGTPRETVENALRAEPGTEVVSKDFDSITYVTHITQKREEIVHQEQGKAPTEEIIERTGPNTYRVKHVAARPVQTILGSRDGPRQIYADGTVVGGSSQRVVTEVNWEIKSQVFFSGGVVDVSKVLSKREVKN